MKSYTDIEQSKKLAEILPLNTADMCWWQIYDTGHTSDYVIKMIPYIFKKDSIPCWSLTALLNVLPQSLIYTPNPTLDGYCCKNIMHDLETYGDNPVDTCYEMIISLHELNLL